MLYTFVTVIIVFASIPRASADGLSDFENLKALIVATTNQVSSSLTFPSINNSTDGTNSTYALPVGAPYPTAEKIQAITAAIDDSRDSCAADSNAFCSNNSMSDLDSSYLDYVNQLPSLAQALVARGRAWRPEWNQPVYTAIGQLSSAVYSYGTELTGANVISEASTIRTISAGGTLMDAEGAWDMTGTLPGKRSILKFGSSTTKQNSR